MADKAREYLMKLPDRLQRVADRIQVPEKQYKFKWIAI
jgi:acyl-[acyl-carrier-protein] desaturase